MRVLCVVPLYPPSSRVGAWITTHEYLRELARRGHQVDVVCLMSNHPRYVFEGVDVWPRLTELDAPDVVVSHLGDQGEGVKVADRVGCPSVRMVHGYADDNRTKLDEYRTDLAVFSSVALAQSTAWAGEQWVAHPPVRPSDYETTPGTKITLSNLSVPKGGETFRLVATSMPDIEFLGVKGGYARQVLTQPHNVTISPAVEDMRSVYSQTRILLMPSERESYGRVGVEAACSGIPTIAHPSPGLEEALGDAATWVDRNDVGGWVQAIRTLQHPGAWLEASRRSRRAVQPDPEGTITRVADEIESLVKVGAT